MRHVRRVIAVGAVGLLAAGCDNAAPPSEEPAFGLPDTVGFAEHVAPIVYENCAVCHRLGGHGPFPLMSYDDVRTHGEAVAQATSIGRMPPWLPEPGPHPLVGERRLSAREVALIRKWVDQGMVEGDRRVAPEAPTFSKGWQLGEPDLVVTMPDPFTLHASGTDRFRNFVIPVLIDRPAYVRAVDLNTGEGHVVHHAIINIDRTPTSRRLDRQAPEPGYDGMFAGSEARSPEGFFLAWTPGKVAHGGTEGMAWRLDPGTDIVLMLHLQPNGRVQPVQASVGLYFADEPPTVLSQWLALASQNIDLAPGSKGIAVEDEYVLPVDVEIFSVYPHAHYLGDVITVNAVLPNDNTVPLIEIPQWNFNQQDAYRFVRPVSLPAGTRLTMRITFDNTDDNPLNPHHPPKRVRYGPASGDEMATVFIQALVEDSADLELLAQDFGLKYRNDLVASMQSMIRVASENPHYHYQLGQALQNLGRLEEAKEAYRNTLEIDPSYISARYDLGNVLQQEGDLAAAMDLYMRVLDVDEEHVSALYNLAVILQAAGSIEDALSMYVRVIALEPTHADAYNNMGNALIESGGPAVAIPYYFKALELVPDHADAHNNLANLYRDAGDLEEAVKHYRAAVAGRPGHLLAHFNLGRTLIEAGQVDAGIAALRMSTRLEPDWPVSLSTLAWTLATHSDVRFRDPAQALIYARRAAEITEFGHPVVLDALAAAYAAAGQFDEAVEAAERGRVIAEQSADTALAGRIAARLAMYQRREAYRAPAEGSQDSSAVRE